MHIEANSLFSYLIDADPATINLVDDALAATKPGIQFTTAYKRAMQNGWQRDWRTHNYNKSNNRFATGLLKKVLEITGDIPLVDNRFANYEEIKQKAVQKSLVYEIPNPKYPMTYFQRDSVLGMAEKGRGQVLLPTNSGKSLTISAAQEIFGQKTLWLVDRKELLYQAVDMYKEYTGKECGYIGDGEFVDSDNMIVAMVPTLIRLPKNKLVEFLKQFVVLIADEAEALRSPSWYSVCMNCPAPFRFAFTGSPPKEKYNYYRMAACTDLEVIMKRSNEENIEDGFSAVPTVYLQPLKYRENKFEYKQAYDSMIRFNKSYASVVADEIYDWYKKGKKILVLVEKTAQGQNISSELRGRKVDAVYIQGQDETDFRQETLDQFRKGEIDILIGTRILARGVDLPVIDCLILAAGGKSEGQQLQRLGRALRRKKGENTVDIIDYVHHGNYYMLKHSLERAELYKNEGFKTVWREKKIEIN